MKNKWFAFVKDCPENEYKVLCFPYAGAGASMFASWTKFFPERGYGLYPVQYPHRESRTSEEMIFDIRQIAEELIDSDEDFFRNQKIILYGKCLGSLIAFYVAEYMKEKLGISPALLVSSSGASPEFMNLEFPENPDDDEKMKQLLLKHNFITSEQLEDEIFSDFFFPVLKGDYLLQADFKDDQKTVDCDIVFLCGTEESHEKEEMITGWKNRTSGSFRSYSIPGGHYFESRDNLNLIIDILDKTVGKERSHT